MVQRAGNSAMFYDFKSLLYHRNSATTLRYGEKGRGQWREGGSVSPAKPSETMWETARAGGQGD